MASSSISSSKRRFALKLAVFIALVVLLDTGLGALLRKYYFRQNFGLNFRTTYAVDKCHEDIIILGSSRAQANLIPTVLENVLGGACYNAGRDGQSLLYALAVQEAILARYTPQIFILDLNPRDFYPHRRHYDRLAALLPYYATHKEIRPILHMRSKLERPKMLSRIYPFNSLALQIVKYNISNEVEHQGHVPLFGEIVLPMPPGMADPPPWIQGDLDPHMVAALARLVENCTRTGVRLCIILSPIYDGGVFGRQALDTVAEVLNAAPYELWDYSADQVFLLNANLFKDRDHLNNIGAMKLSDILARRIINSEP